MNEFLHCPDCGKDVPSTTRKCSCGHVFAFKKRANTSCAFNGCPDSGSLSESATQGGLWYCRRHWSIKHGGKPAPINDGIKLAFNQRLREVDKFVMDDLRSKTKSIREVCLSYMKRNRIKPPVFEDESAYEAQLEREAIQGEDQSA